MLLFTAITRECFVISFVRIGRVVGVVASAESARELTPHGVLRVADSTAEGPDGVRREALVGIQCGGRDGFAGVCERRRDGRRTRSSTLELHSAHQTNIEGRAGHV